MPHDFRNNDAVVAVRGAVQPVNRIGGDVKCRGKAESVIRHRHVVVNRLGQRDDVETGFVKAQGTFLRATAAEANERVKAVTSIIFDDDIGHVVNASVNRHAMRLVATCAENGSANGENAGECGFIELQAPVFDQAAKAVTETDYFHAVKTEHSFTDAANGRVQTGAVTACRQNADAFGLCHCPAKLTMCRCLSSRS